MAIKLKGYTPGIRNQIYKRNCVMDVDGKKNSFKEIIYLARFTEPDEEKIVSKLIETTIGSSLSSFRINQSPFESHLEILVAQLPLSMKMPIISGDKGFLDFIRTHIPRLELPYAETPRHFVYLKSGLIPNETLKVHKEEIAKSGAKWYNSALSNEGLIDYGFGEKSVSNFIYDPQKNSFLQIRNENKFWDLIREGIKKPQDFYLLQDITEDMIEKAALVPVEKLLKIHWNEKEKQGVSLFI